MFKKAKDLLKKLNKIDTNTLDDDDSSEESSEIEPTEWMKKCGHNCQMWQTKRCCACSDTRPVLKSMIRSVHKLWYMRFI